MKCQMSCKLLAMTAGLTTTATSIFALPADVGRTADVISNALRYQAATQAVAAAKTAGTQALAKEDAVHATPLAAINMADLNIPTQFMEDAAFGAPVAPTHLASAQIPTQFMEDKAFEAAVAPVALASLNLPLAPMEDRAFDAAVAPVQVATLNIPATYMEDAAFKAPVAPVALASLNLPTGPMEDKAFGAGLAPVQLASLKIPTTFMEDAAFKTPVAPVALASLDIPLAPMEDAAFETAVAPVALASLNIPASFMEDVAFGEPVTELHLASLKASGFVDDAAFEVALVAITPDTFDVPPALFAQQQTTTDPAVVQASLSAIDAISEANTSSRAADVVDASASGADLMSEMAAADDNMEMREGADTMMMSSDVLFSFGKAELAPEAIKSLAKLGDMAADVAVLEVFGHTDAIGSEDNNRLLGQKRAEAVRDWLLSHTAFTADQVVATGIGEVDPVAPNVTAAGNDNPDGRALNRRVEFGVHAAGY